MLPTRDDSEKSWTIDFAARLQKALDEAKPFREKAAEWFAQAKALEADWRELKKAGRGRPVPSKKKVGTSRPHSGPGAACAQLEKLETEWRAIEKQARESEGKALKIEDAVFDLKAVNPNRDSEQDTRTPPELLDFITEKDREVGAALGHLRILLGSR